ncbi:MAG: hydroxypyruvate reductase [Rhodomicrobium sp.]|nr:MAG: hydroxypyruvate reductase [Rhodomicrobium sp.]
MDSDSINGLLLESFEHFVNSAHPRETIQNYIPGPPKGRTLILGAGKASAAMAAEFERHYDAPLEGLIITRYGHKVPTSQVKVIEAAHPVPDENGRQAVEELISLARSARPSDLVVCLISGGGSALLSAPVEGVSFPAIQNLTKALLASGAEIDEINCVRKHLNKLLGGGLASLMPETQVITLAISDVIGDDPGTIASGPTVGDNTSLGDARQILEKYQIKPEVEITAALLDEANETRAPDDTVFTNNSYHLISAPAQSLKAAASFWQSKGFEPIIYNEDVGGDTNQAAKDHVAFVQKFLHENSAISRPTAILSGGETTVKLTGKGEGGPNTQFILQAAITLAEHPGVYALAADSDGYDGSADNAGARLTPETLASAKAKGLDAAALLAGNDSYNFFKPLGQLVITGATYTNINDYRVFLLTPGALNLKDCQPDQ